MLLDVYADWCTSCKEMERVTFEDPAVRSRLARAERLRLDVTANSSEDRRLLKRFGLFGPPGLLFFDAGGNERRDARVVGYVAPAEFGVCRSLRRACRRRLRSRARGSARCAPGRRASGHAMIARA